MTILRWMNHWSTYVVGGAVFAAGVFMAVHLAGDPSSPVVAYPRDLVAETFWMTFIAVLVTLAVRLVLLMFRVTLWVLQPHTSDIAKRARVMGEKYRGENQ